MTYTKEELWEVLENSDVIIKVKDGYLINSIFKRAISGQARTGFCINYPSAFIGLSDALIYKRVMEECRIPLMVKGSVSYFVRTQTKEAVRTLKAIFNNEDIDYNVFISSTKNFYASGITFPGFAKFLSENTWETVYGTGTEREQASQKGIL